MAEHSQLAPLIISATYLLIYAINLIFLTMYIRFTVQIKVVLVMLFLASSIQIVGCYITYKESLSDTRNLKAPQTLYRVSQSFTMVIYNFMVCRMCYIYSQIVQTSSTSAKGCRLWLSRFMARFQTPIIAAYFLLANTYYLTAYFVY